ncbi:MAG: hypothetical protein KGL33_07240 [Betaproteobacteria bacterium]|nr:hypothetical protein [Betaproteobacteria bacterium]
MRKISEFGKSWMEGAAPEPRRGPSEDAARSAARLMAALGGMSPAVAAQTRDPAAARVWIDVWARQIQAADLTAAELAAGLDRVKTIPPSQPLGWQQFYWACRPAEVEGVRAADLEARRCNLPALPDEATKRRRIEAAKRALADPRVAKFLRRVSPDAE